MIMYVIQKYYSGCNRKNDLEWGKWLVFEPLKSSKEDTMVASTKLVAVGWS